MMAKLPDVTALGPRPTPQPSASLTGAKMLSQGAGALAQAQMNSGFEALQQAGAAFGQAVERIQARGDAVARARDYGSFFEQGEKELQRLLTEDDVSKPEVAEKYSQFLRDSQDKIIGAHGGSEASRAALAERTETVRQSLVAKATSLSLDAQHKVVSDHMGGTINRLVAKTYETPASLVEQFRTLDAEIDNMSAALRPEQERSFRLVGRERIAEGAIGSMIGRGATAEAKNLMLLPGISEILGEGAQKRINAQIIQAENVVREAETSGLRIRMQFQSMFGRPPANDQELFQFIGKPGAQPDRSVVEIGDASSPTGTRMIPRDLVGQNLNPEILSRYPAGTPKAGLNVEFGPGGTVSKITTGPQGPPGGMTPTTQAALEKKTVDAQEGLARLGAVQQKFKPEYQTYATRGATWWAAVKEKSGVELPTGEKAQLEGFAKYRREALHNINLYIKEITGAQMSIYEIDRLKAGLPDPGTGVFDGDSPSEFQSKLTDTIKSLRLASARHIYALRNGLDPTKTGIALGDVEGIMRKRQGEIEKEIKSQTPDIAGDALVNLLRARLAKEFGLD